MLGSAARWDYHLVHMAQVEKMEKMVVTLGARDLFYR